MPPNPVGACPAGDPSRPTKPSRAGLAPTKSGESPKPFVGACPAGDSPGIPQTLASRARSYEKRGKTQAPRRSLPCRRLPGHSPQNLASRARSYENPKTLRLRPPSAVDFHIPPPSLSVFAPSREHPLLTFTPAFPSRLRAFARAPAFDFHPRLPFASWRLCESPRLCLSPPPSLPF